MVYILVKLLFFSEKKKKTGTRLSVFYIHVHNNIIIMLLACKYYDMKERNEKKK